MAPFVNPSPTRYAVNSAADAFRRMLAGAQAYGEQNEGYRGPADYGMSAQYGGAKPNMTQAIAGQVGSMLDSYEENMGGLDLHGQGGAQFTPSFDLDSLPEIPTPAVMQDNLLRPGSQGGTMNLPFQPPAATDAREQMIQLLNSAPAPRGREQLSADAARLGLPQPVSTFGYDGGDPGAVGAAQQAARQRWQNQTGTLYQGDPGLNPLLLAGGPSTDIHGNTEADLADPFGMGENQGAEYAEKMKQQRAYARMSSARQPGPGGQMNVQPDGRAELLAQMNDATGVGAPMQNRRAQPSPEYQAALDQRKENVRLRQMGKAYGMHPLGLQNYEDKRQIMLGGLNGEGIDLMQMQALGMPPELIRAKMENDRLTAMMQQQGQQFGQEQQRLMVGTEAEAAEKQAAAAIMKQRMDTIATMTPQQQMQMLMGGNAPEVPISDEQKLEQIWTQQGGDFDWVPFGDGSLDNQGDLNDFLGYTSPQAIPNAAAAAYYERMRSGQPQAPSLLELMGLARPVVDALQRQ